MFKVLADLANKLDDLGASELASKIDAILQARVVKVAADTNPLGPITDSNRMQEKNKLIQQLLAMLLTQKAITLPPVIADGVLTPPQIKEIERIAGKAGVGYKTYQELSDKLVAEIRKRSPNALVTFRIPA